MVLVTTFKLRVKRLLSPDAEAPSFISNEPFMLALPLNTTNIMLSFPKRFEYSETDNIVMILSLLGAFTVVQWTCYLLRYLASSLISAGSSFIPSIWLEKKQESKIRTRVATVSFATGGEIKMEINVRPLKKCLLPKGGSVKIEAEPK